MGLLISLGCLYVGWKAGDYFERYPEKENKYLLATSIISILAFLYMLYKPYPLDFAHWELLLDPDKVVRSAYDCTGAVLGFCCARYIEKTWIRFEVTGWNAKGFVCGLIGIIPLYVFYIYAEYFFVAMIGSNWGRFVWSFCLVFYIIALYPLAMKQLASKEIHLLKV